MEKTIQRYPSLYGSSTVSDIMVHQNLCYHIEMTRIEGIVPKLHIHHNAITHANIPESCNVDVRPSPPCLLLPPD